jgi:hypothetical protein
VDVLSIGILAHNEAAIIDRTLASLAGQSILDPACAAALGVEAIEILVVPNGCSDDTAAVAATALVRMPAHVATSVRDLPEPGKSNAWNRFVHDLARPDATLLVLMDADIEFGSADVVERLVRRLHERPVAAVSTDRAVKDYRRKRLTPLDLFSRRVSKQQASDGGLCGQLYCARAAALRQIWLPSGLPVEDGFLAAMLVTDGFTRPSDDRAISCVSDAFHFYEPLTGVAAFVRHEARIIVGSVINAWLFALLWDAGRQGHVGEYVRRRNAEDPHWVEAVCARARAGHPRWLVPDAFIWWRLAPLRRQPFVRAATRAPVALAATLAALPAVLRANAILRRPAARLHW